MRKDKPLPRESSFREYSENREKSGSRKSTGRSRRPSSGARSSSSGNRSSGVKSGFKQNFRKRDSKPDRRESRGNSFKEDRRQGRSNGRQEDREMFDSVCSKCGKACKVPFKPTNGKPVLCSDCFRKDNGRQSTYRNGDNNSRSNWKDIDHSSRGIERRSRNTSINNGQKFARTNGGVRELFDAVCMQCGNKCKVPFKPTTGKGVSCSNCYNKNKKPFNKTGGANRGKKSFGDKRSSFSKRR